MANGEAPKFKLDPKQLWDSVRFIVAVIFTAGVLYATVTAAVSDISEVKEEMKLRVTSAEKTHEVFDSRLKELELQRAEDRQWKENVMETLKRIESNQRRIK